MTKNDQNTLLDQYKLFVEMADRISERRLKTNQFYISVASGLMAVLAFIFGKDNFHNLKDYQDTVVLIVSLLAISLNCLWLINIRSFRRLNSGKFEVIHEMEELLSFQPYKREWQIIKKGDKAKNYFQLSRIEQYLPLILSCPFLVLIILILI